DTCRLWDVYSGERLDKDRFRRDLGGVEEAYQEVADRILGARGTASAVAVEASGLEPHGHDHEQGPGHDHGHPAEPHHHAIVDVMLKRSILDPQGRAVQNTLHRLGHDNVVDLRVGKRIEITLLG